MLSASDAHNGFVVSHAAFSPSEVDELRAGVEAAVGRAVALAKKAATTAVDGRDHRIQVVPGDPPTSVHWEPDADPPVVRNLRPVTHLDPRLAARWTDPRLTAPAADLLGVSVVGPLTSKLSLKRAQVGSAYGWHTDHSFLAGFLGPDAAGQVVTAMVLLDAAHADNGALTLVPRSHQGKPRADDQPPRPSDADPVLVEAAAGSVLFFPSQMIHRSGANHSHRDRRALLYLFQPAGRPHLDETRVWPTTTVPR